MQWILCTVFFLFSVGLFYCFTFFSSVWMAREFEHHGASPCVCHSDLFYTSVLRFEFWHTLPLLPDFLPVRNWQSLGRGSFPPPSRAVPIHLGSWDCSSVCWEEMGWEVCCWSQVRAQGPWRGFILLFSTCWSLWQLVWAATVLGWCDSRDVRTPATIRPLLAQT